MLTESVAVYNQIPIERFSTHCFHCIVSFRRTIEMRLGRQVIGTVFWRKSIGRCTPLPWKRCDIILFPTKFLWLKLYNSLENWWAFRQSFQHALLISSTVTTLCCFSDTFFQTHIQLVAHHRYCYCTAAAWLILFFIAIGSFFVIGYWSELIWCDLFLSEWQNDVRSFVFIPAASLIAGQLTTWFYWCAASILCCCCNSRSWSVKFG